MNISEKLKLQRRLGGVVLFREGMFLRGYNESCYILTQILQHDLKIKCYQVKQYNHTWIAMCGFPVGQLNARLPAAVFTDYGGHLVGDFDMSKYGNWFSDACLGAGEASATDETREKLATAGFRRVSLSQNPTKNQLEITDQQMEYLQNWQKHQHPIETDLHFIESLKQQFTKIN